MPKVFVAQRQPHLDMAQAEEFGTVEYVLPTGTQIWTDKDVGEFVDIARRKIKDAKPDDMMVLTGDPVMCGMLFAMLSDKMGGIVNVLKWDRRRGEYGGYAKISVDIDQQPSY